MTDDLDCIRELLPAARRIGAEKGCMHAIWEVLFDGEALLAGRETYISKPRDEAAKWVADTLSKMIEERLGNG